MDPVRRHPATTALLLPLLALLVVLALLPARAQAAAAPPGMPPRGKVMLGMGGHGESLASFDQRTRRAHDLYLVTVPWNEDRTWEMALGRQLQDAADGGYRLMVHLGTQHVDDGREGRSPGAVARGEADAYLLDLARVLNESGQFTYLRPPAEMNGHWSQWSAFDKDGSARDADHSTRSYRNAFIRIALIAKGGSVTGIDKRLALRGMPPVATDETYLPRSGRVATVFNPQARGKPDRRGNQPWDYYPGRPFVDYVANDLYAQRGRAAWSAQDALYRRYARWHPFMVAEYAPWGYDDPRFVTQMFRWVATHPRTVALVYFNGTSGTTFRLSTKPRSLARYRLHAREHRYRCPAFDAFVATCTAPLAEQSRAG